MTWFLYMTSTCDSSDGLLLDEILNIWFAVMWNISHWNTLKRSPLLGQLTLSWLFMCLQEEWDYIVKSIFHLLTSSYLWRAHWISWRGSGLNHSLLLIHGDWRSIQKMHAPIIKEFFWENKTEIHFFWSNINQKWSCCYCWYFKYIFIYLLASKER